jgi:hypothetical protein
MKGEKKISGKVSGVRDLMIAQLREVCLEAIVMLRKEVNK